jgi:hypothetical protein
VLRQGSSSGSLIGAPAEETTSDHPPAARTAEEVPNAAHAAAITPPLGMRQAPVLRQSSSVSSVGAASAVAADSFVDNAGVDASETQRAPVLRQGASSVSSAGAATPAVAWMGDHQAAGERALQTVEALGSDKSHPCHQDFSLMQRRWRARRVQELRSAARRAGRSDGSGAGGSQGRRRQGDDADDDADDGDPYGFTSLCVCCLVLCVVAIWILCTVGLMFGGLLYYHNQTAGELWEGIQRTRAHNLGLDYETWAPLQPAQGGETPGIRVEL